MHSDDEAHVLVSCPEHGVAREEFVSQLSLETCTRLAQTRSDQDKLMVLLGSCCEQDCHSCAILRTESDSTDVRQEERARNSSRDFKLKALRRSEWNGGVVGS